jgi:solute carrier family 45 protein 1/2/4
LTIILAVIAVYLMDFAINAAMAVDRALLVDMLPSSKQALANAWAARMSGIGSVVGFFV